MVMAPITLPTITSNSASAAAANKKKRNATRPLSASFTLTANSTATKKLPLPVRSASVATETSASTVRTNIKRQNRAVPVDDDDTERDDTQNDVEEEDGFLFRRKGSVSKSAPVPKKKTMRVRRMSTIDSSPLQSMPSQQKSEENSHQRTTKRKATVKSSARKKTKSVKPTDFNFNGIADIPMSNGSSYHEDATHKQRTPIPKHTGKRNNTSFKHPLVVIDEADSAATNGHYDHRNLTPSPTPKSQSRSQQIMLPLSDTPIIKKNKEMRKQKSGVRRSSLGNRGKRASSIGNGLVAVPHPAVSPQEFYKHLDSDLSEPHRMRQLLIWSLKRVMEKQKPTFEQIKLDPTMSVEDKTAINVVRFIQEEIVRDLIEMRIDSSWWNRPENRDFTETVKKPNVQNVTNLNNHKAFEKRYKDLLEEKEQWEARLKEVEKLSNELMSSNFKLSPADKEKAVYKQYPFLEKLNDPSSSSKLLLQRLENGLDELEREVDKLDDFVHLTKSISRATPIFSNKKMDILSEQAVAAHNNVSSLEKSTLYKVVEKSKIINGKDFNPQVLSSNDNNVKNERISLRDILRTITKLESNLS